ncbi:MAG: DUF1236 domain-containing protein [Pseudolabrys sp.]
MVKDMTPREEQQGTSAMFVWSTIVLVAAAVGLMVWFFVPGFSQTNEPNIAANGQRSNETQGMSVTAQVTKPTSTSSPHSTDPSTVGRNERLTGSATPNVDLTPDQVGALKAYVNQHGDERVDSANFTMTVGAAVPGNARLRDIPAQLAKSLSNFQNDQYIVVGSQFIIVEKQTRRIVAIVPV